MIGIEQIQTALFAALTDGDIGASVYDRVPQNASSYPFAVIGNDEDLLPWDTDSEHGCDAQLRIHVWSRYDGQKEVKQIMRNLYDLLHDQELEIPGYFVVMQRVTQSSVFIEPDGKTRHGVVEIQIVVDRNEDQSE